MADKKKSTPTYKERYEQRIGRHKKNAAATKKAAAPKKKEEKKSGSIMGAFRDTLGLGTVSKQIKKAAKR